jgi:DNA-binding CsgD family transcriptional regulator/PAS domain-containing protein
MYAEDRILSSVIQKMYSAATAPGDTAAADAIRRYVGAEHVVLFEAAGEARSWRACSNIGAGHRAKIDAITEDQTLLGGIAGVETGQMVLQSSLFDNEQMRRTPIYQECIRPLEGGLSALMLWRGPQGFASVHLCRSLERGVDFGADDMARLAALAPHIRISESLRGHAAAADRELAAMASALDAAPMGIAALDRSGAVMFANAQASRLLDPRHGLMLEGRRVRCVAPRPAERLARAIAAVLGLGMAPLDAAALSRLDVSVPRREPMAPLTVSVSPPSALASANLSGVGAVLLIRDPQLSPGVSEAELAVVYDLTRREAQLSARLAGGDSLTAAALHLGVTPGTARQYLKRVFDKTGVHRQPDLVRLLLQPRL